MTLNESSKRKLTGVHLEQVSSIAKIRLRPAGKISSYESFKDGECHASVGIEPNARAGDSGLL